MCWNPMSVSVTILSYGQTHWTNISVKIEMWLIATSSFAPLWWTSCWSICSCGGYSIGRVFASLWPTCCSLASVESFKTTFLWPDWMDFCSDTQVFLLWWCPITIQMISTTRDTSVLASYWCLRRGPRGGIVSPGSTSLSCATSGSWWCLSALTTSLIWSQESS